MNYKVKCSQCQSAVINGVSSHESGCHGVMIFTDRHSREFNEARVWALDVWGNGRDGFEVNDRSELDSVMIPHDGSRYSVVKALKKAGMLNKKCHYKSFHLENDDGYGFFVTYGKSAVPLLQIEFQ